MAFGTQDDTDEVMNEINVTPMVDVMLVLLIIFIITVPVMKNSVNIDLPRASSQRLDPKPETVRLSVDAQGNYFWNNSPTDDRNLAVLLKTAALKTPQPELHISGDKAVRYERVAQAMAAAQQAGIKKIGFITEPPKQP
ncbi:biopolymer transporter ExbD [Polaromonas sp. C04]|uniref:ExbD/TolR family protein n=1 Tax=Polaromonas sp. C04 TaxID=1945857 RepID=UPI0009864C9F|nr:biopolymer transporter ExbD [Polaromonas sp. C04]OOG53069.1 biopolymer transporter ExbD [Polaromonas sp. C04]